MHKRNTNIKLDCKKFCHFYPQMTRIFFYFGQKNWLKIITVKRVTADTSNTFNINKS